MFYVSEGRIYSMVPTTEGKYPELKIKDGALVSSGKSVDGKPANRKVCILEEVLAQFNAEEEPEEEVKPAPIVAKKTK